MILAVTALAAAAAAQPGETVSISDPGALVPILQSAGYQAKLDMTGKAPRIETATSGLKYSIFFQGCTAGRDCKDLLFYAGWEAGEKRPSLERINEFNRKNRFGRAYIDDENDPIVEMDVMVTDQKLNRKAFDESLDVWSRVVTTFAKHIDME